MIAVDSHPKLPRLIDFAELMHLTSLSRSRLYQLCEAGELKPIKLGKKTVFEEAAVIQWINSKISQAA